MNRISFSVLAGVIVLFAPPNRLPGSEEFTLTPSGQRHRILGVVPDGAFIVEGEMDPSLTTGGNLQALAAISLGWKENEVPEVRSTARPNVTVEVREGNGIGSWTVWVDGVDESEREPDPKPAGWALHPQYQRFNRFLQRDGAYRIRIVGIPREDSTLLRFYFEHLDRPLFEFAVEHDLVGTAIHAHVPVGNGDTFTNESRFDLSLEKIPEEEAAGDPEPREIVLRALDYSHPQLASVATAVRKGDLKGAGRLLLRHMRTRSGPRGPGWEDVSNFVLHPDNRTIAEHNVEGRYGNLAWFAEFDSQWTDAKGEVHQRILPDGSINWARENGHLNRHFHWVALAKTYEETGQAKYAERFSFTVQGVHTRQVVFVKGEDPPATAYWIVVDSVDPADDEEHEFKALFHSRRDLAEIDPKIKSFTCVDRGAGYRILPGTTEGLELRDAKGQTEPYIQGWHIVGTNKAPMHTAEYSWRTKGPTRRIWILEATNLPASWQVESWSERDDVFEVVRSGGEIDRIHFAPESHSTVSSIETLSDGRLLSQIQLPSAP